MACRCYSPAPVPRSFAHSRASALALWASLGALVVPTACRGWRGAGDTYYAHRVPAKRARSEGSFRFGLPGAPWRPLRRLRDVQVAWVHPDQGAVIAVRAQCDDQGDSDLYQYTDHIRIDWTDWVVVKQTETRLVDRAALQTIATGRLDGVAMQLELWVVKRAGCLFDLNYVAPPARFAEGQASFATVVEGFDFPL